MEVVFVRCRRLLKYNFDEILRHKEPKALAVGFFAVFAPFAVNQIMTNSPHPFFGSPAAPPLAFTLPGCPSRSAPSALVVWGASRRFCEALWLPGYLAVPECGMEVVFVRCRQLLKYIIYFIKL
jgi:hypothetical protein